MNLHLVLLLMILATWNKVSRAERGKLIIMASNAQTMFSSLHSALSKELNEAQVSRLRAHAKNIGRKLKYFSDTLKDTEFQELAQHLAAAEAVLNRKATRNVLGTPVKLIQNTLDRVAKLITDDDLYKKIKKVAGKSVKAGFDILGAATNVASTAMDVLYPTGENVPMGIIDGIGSTAVDGIKHGYVKDLLRPNDVEGKFLDKKKL